MLVTCEDNHDPIVYEALSYTDPCPLCYALANTTPPELLKIAESPVESEQAVIIDTLSKEIEQLKQLLRGVTCQLKD